MDQDAIVQLLGRLHPMLLHMPIGLWVGVVALEFGGALIRRAPSRATLAILTWMAALLGAIAAGSGWILGTSGYHSSTIELHRWLGVGAAAIGLVTAACGAMQNRDAFRLLLVLEFVVLMAAGHFGNEETRGKEWLLEPFQKASAGTGTNTEVRDATQTDAAPPADSPIAPTTDAADVAPLIPVLPAAEQQSALQQSAADATHDPKPLFPPVEPRKPIERDAVPTRVAPTQPTPSTPQEAGKPVSFGAQIEPILKTYCASCHSGTRKKGGLRLHTQAAILHGGENGAVVKAGDAANSPLHALLLLPPDDERHMPPSDKKQPTTDEIELLRLWIEQGATFDVAEQPEPSPNAPVKDSADESKAQETAAAPIAPWTTAAQAAMQALQAQQVHAARVAEGSDDLWVDFSAVAATMDDAQICAQTAALAPWIADLSVARSAAADATLAACASMPRLRRLDLRSTKATSEHVKLLLAHPCLQEVVLADTAIDDSCVEALLALPSLRHVYVWNTKLSERGIARLCLRNGLTVDVGETAAVKVAEASAETAVPAPKPRNTTCPVSGSPVDLRYTVLFEGRAVGFCCPNCPRSFWTEPAKFPVADR